jgi:hypothetical protein
MFFRVRFEVATQQRLYTLQYVIHMTNVHIQYYIYESGIANLVQLLARGSKPGVRFPVGQDFLFSIASRLAVGWTESPIQWVPKAVSPG